MQTLPKLAAVATALSIAFSSSPAAFALVPLPTKPATTVKANAKVKVPAPVPSTAVTEEDILSNIDLSEEDIVIPTIDGKGGGVMDSMSMIAPYYGGGVTVDAQIVKEVTPDFVAINAWCNVNSNTRADIRVQLDKMYADIKAAVGTNGKVRKTGGYSVNPVYDTVGKPSTDDFQGTLNVFIRVTNTKANMQIVDVLDAKGCSQNWDVRLTDTQSYELDILDQLITKLNKRKTVFEKLLKKSLTRVIGASLNTWVDGYSSYDPETNMADATTTLSVTFDVGGRATITPSPSPRPLRVNTPSSNFLQTGTDAATTNR